MPDGGAKVVIVGAGFGGIEAAKSLRRAPVEVTVIDRQNHHCFQPLLYQVATAALSGRRGLADPPHSAHVVAPDCGLKYLPRDVAFGKIYAMFQGAKIVRRELTGHNAT
jgi:UDP-N-acetylmuramoylalanine-D-glutamate ligase